MYLTLGLILGANTRAFRGLNLVGKKLGIRAQVSLGPGRYLSHKQRQTLPGWVQGPKAGQKTVLNPLKLPAANSERHEPNGESNELPRVPCLPLRPRDITRPSRWHCPGSRRSATPRVE